MNFILQVTFIVNVLAVTTTSDTQTVKVVNWNATYAA